MLVPFDQINVFYGWKHNHHLPKCVQASGMEETRFEYNVKKLSLHLHKQEPTVRISSF